MDIHNPIWQMFYYKVALHPSIDRPFNDYSVVVVVLLGRAPSANYSSIVIVLSADEDND